MAPSRCATSGTWAKSGLAAASAYVDTSAAMALVTSYRNQTIALFDQLAIDLPSIATLYSLDTPLSAIMEQAYGSSLGGADMSSFLGGYTLPDFPDLTAPSPTPVPTPVPTAAPQPATLPDMMPIGPAPNSGDGMRLYGDTPMLLRETDPSIPAQAAFTRVAGTLEYVSPAASLENLTVGSYRTATEDGFWDLLQDAAEIAWKGLLGVGSQLLGFGDFYAKTENVLEIGEAQSKVVEGTIGVIRDGMEVINGGPWASSSRATTPSPPVPRAPSTRCCRASSPARRPATGAPSSASWSASASRTRSPSA